MPGSPSNGLAMKAVNTQWWFASSEFVREFSGSSKVLYQPELHKRLGHVNVRLIQDLARAGKLPDELARCKPPLCVDCLHGKAI
jgi:hypothetical protein